MSSRGCRRKHRQNELSDFGDESRQFAGLFAEPAPTNKRAPLDSTGGIAVDVKTERVALRCATPRGEVVFTVHFEPQAELSYW